MKPLGNIPKAENIPELHINIEQLRRHSFLCTFVSEPSLSAEETKLRAWLVHTLASAARRYSIARELVQSQDNADQIRDGGLILYVLDVPEQIEGCITAIHRVCTALIRMKSFEPANEFSSICRKSIGQLTSIRNQFEHMHKQNICTNRLYQVKQAAAQYT